MKLVDWMSDRCSDSYATERGQGKQKAEQEQQRKEVKKRPLTACNSLWNVKLFAGQNSNYLKMDQLDSWHKS